MTTSDGRRVSSHHSSCSTGRNSLSASRRSAIFNECLDQVKEAIFDFACRRKYQNLFSTCAKSDYPIDQDIMLPYVINQMALNINHVRFARISLEDLLKLEKDEAVRNILGVMLHLANFMYVSLRIRRMSTRDLKERQKICAEILELFPDEGSSTRNREKRRTIRQHLISTIADYERLRSFKKNFDKESGIMKAYPNFQKKAALLWKTCRERKPAKLKFDEALPNEPAWVLLREHLNWSVDPGEELLLSFVNFINTREFLSLSVALDSNEDSPIVIA
ncbi:hypothetical protein L596_008169 [Steinernema carpocapsae]|uniref:Uncharacterized protein n=1 Tax=Steinernema carpocapsae TaxID=34508 RepID=A0A4U5PBM0_STECR|nr:hypothetical protein L596_008169 [Steinernema carpocapsae]